MICALNRRMTDILRILKNVRIEYKKNVFQRFILVKIFIFPWLVIFSKYLDGILKNAAKHQTK